MTQKQILRYWKPTGELVVQICANVEDHEDPVCQFCVGPLAWTRIDRSETDDALYLRVLTEMRAHGDQILQEKSGPQDLLTDVVDLEDLITLSRGKGGERISRASYEVLADLAADDTIETKQPARFLTNRWILERLGIR